MTVSWNRSNTQLDHAWPGCHYINCYGGQQKSRYAISVMLLQLGNSWTSSQPPQVLSTGPKHHWTSQCVTNAWVIRSVISTNHESRITNLLLFKDTHRYLGSYIALEATCNDSILVLTSNKKQSSFRNSINQTYRIKGYLKLQQRISHNFAKGSRSHKSSVSSRHLSATAE